MDQVSLPVIYMHYSYCDFVREADTDFNETLV